MPLKRLEFSDDVPGQQMGEFITPHNYSRSSGQIII